jgi:hypothetical protein
MIAALMIAFTVFTGQAKADAVVLPDTPQGKAVQAWVKAFNSGDEKTFLTVQDELMSPAVLSKRTPEDRANMFQRMKGDFGTMTIEKVTKATPQQIKIQVPTQDGATGTFTFDFEEKAPFKIIGLGIDVQAGGGI